MGLSHIPLSVISYQLTVPNRLIHIKLIEIDYPSVAWWGLLEAQTSVPAGNVGR